MKDGTAWDQPIETLFQIPVVRFRIVFHATVNLRTEGIEPAFRGRLGFRLKQSWCSYDDFRHSNCNGCNQLDNCHYVKLFTPNMLKSPIVNQKRTQLRPFVFKIERSAGSEKVLKGETGSLEFCLFGPAIDAMPFFAKSACEAAESLPMKVRTISLIAPKHVTFPQNADSGEKPSGKWKLADFLKPELQPNKYLLAHFVTPVHILSGGNPLGIGDISFDHLILSMITRLRDLKRCYGDGTDMGKIPDDFSKLANEVHIVQNSLSFSKKKRFSKRQERDIWLSGLKGKLYFTGPFQRFSNILKASEITRIGKDASEGNGVLHFSVSDILPE